MSILKTVFHVFLFAVWSACGCTSEPADPVGTSPAEVTVTESQDSPAATVPSETITLGAGCFWCIEAVLEQVDGITDVVSGYMGGAVIDPTYEQVCSGTTGHAEVVQVHFDPSRIDRDLLLDWFWQAHDPTTLNRQGNDIGTQYRSAVFYHSEEQRIAAEASRDRAQAKFTSAIVTEITPASTFYSAEAYHQDYYRANKQQGYCRFIIAPKLEKLGLEK
ncbi:MAG: peptide-methionine (S)-S-oxide reductase MsrA [Planctomycetota bacterium]|nr:peptide-methionine (S)-S-oxide reductase MsrA [Planctomycetota bacterium]MDA0934177.1 peptide-methionine (S)-S-oxide reductase MsrA [Planctomycetota bacterium]